MKCLLLGAVELPVFLCPTVEQSDSFKVTVSRFLLCDLPVLGAVCPGNVLCACPVKSEVISPGFSASYVFFVIFRVFRG